MLKIKLLVLGFSILVFIIYLFTSAGKTPYDYFTRLSDAFLQGKYYLSYALPWLNELIPAGIEKYFVVYPPMPAILAMPFRFAFGEKFEQQFLAHLLGVGITIIAMAISWKVKKGGSLLERKKLLIWTGILVGFGNIIWYLSATGSAWYLGQISAAFFLTAAIYESLNKKRAILVGIMLGAAYLSRVEIVLTFPFFLYIFSGKKYLNNYLKIALGILPFLFTNFTYNFIRFGVIWDKAYMLIPGVLEETWYQKGLVNPIYIPNHLKIIFLALPKFIKEVPYIIPSWAGLAIWITTPAFVYAFLANIKDRIVQYSWISIILISFLIFSHGTTGFAQFGYRFAVDFYPFLIFLTIKSVSETKLKWHHWLLLFISVFVNTWGVVFINIFGWVGF
jgi:hypothetical protein